MKKFFSLVLALAMALSMASFASAEETTTIHIGVIGPMTGAAAVYGLAVARGAEIAVEEINAAGKVNIVLDVQDDENDAEKSINAYNATLDKGTQVILGCVTTTPCIAVSAQAYDERVFMLTPSASSLEVIANKDNAYQVCFTDPAQGSASAEYIFNKKVGEKVAIIYNNADTYSTGIYQTFESKAAELGAEHRFRDHLHQRHHGLLRAGDRGQERRCGCCVPAHLLHPRFPDSQRCQHHGLQAGVLRR